MIAKPPIVKLLDGQIFSLFFPQGMEAWHGEAEKIHGEKGGVVAGQLVRRPSLAATPANALRGRSRGETYCAWLERIRMQFVVFYCCRW